jgi:hypothetical protein
LELSTMTIISWLSLKSKEILFFATGSEEIKRL